MKSLAPFRLKSHAKDFMNANKSTLSRPFSGNRVLPGFQLTLGFTLLYLCLIVLFPLSALLLNTLAMTWEAFWQTVSAPRVVASYRLSFGASLAAASVNAVFGTVLAWVLVRYQFPGKKLLDAFVDLPFALPTAVAGIALTALYASNGWLGQHLAKFDIKVAFTPLGVAVALVFMIFPTIFPAVLTGFALAFARALGEYGSVIFIAGNMPMVSEITPLLIITKLEQYDYRGATAIAVVMLGASFVMLLAINLLQAWMRKSSTKERK